MTPLRRKEKLKADLAALTGLLQATPEDPLATRSLRNSIQELEQALAALAERPPLAPEAEIFFVDGPADGSQDLEATFTSHILDSYQNMVTNHYSAKHYGTLRRSGRRRGEAETKLFLTALPRGSFGIQLGQPHVPDFVAADHLSTAMKEVSELVEASADSDGAFETALNTFNPRVLKPLQRFIETLFAGKGACRVVTGFKETKLSETQIEEAYVRVTAATEREEIIRVPGIFGGVLMFSWEFDFQPDAGDMIHGTVAEEVTEEAARVMNEDFTTKRAIATLKEITVQTRTGRKKPAYELTELQPIEEPPAARTATPAPEAKPPGDDKPPGGK